MAKSRTMGAGNGVTGPTGSDYRLLINDMIPNESYIVPIDFNWGASLITYANKTLKVTNEHTVTGTITLPANSVIDFDGGAFTGTFTLVGNNSQILNMRNTACLPLTVTFSGNWTETKAAPQWFGAICSPNPKTIPGAMVPGGDVNLNRRNEGGAVSSSAAIQKLFDSPFQPVFPNGYYYITATTVITRSVYVDFGNPIREHIDEIDTFHFKNDHVRFYTDQDINFWELRSPYGTYVSTIFLIGGVMDVQLLSSFSKNIYYLSAAYQFAGGEASGDAVGSLTAARVEGGIGTYFRWDMTTPAYQFGYMTAFKIKTRSFYLNRGIIIDKPSGSDVAPYTWVNSLDINAMFDGFKVAANIEDGGLGDIKVVAQSRPVNTINELTLQCITIGSPDSKIQAFVWDMSATPTGGYYTPQSGYSVLYTAPPYLIGDANTFAYNRTNKSINRAKAVKPVTHESLPVFLAQKSTRDTYFSEFHNSLIGFHKITGNSVIMKAFQGGAMNFTTELRDGATIGLTESANYTITYANNLFEQRGTPPSTTIVEAANRNTDFIEIMLTAATAMQFEAFYISVVENVRTFKKIQLICVPAAGDSVLFSEDCNGHSNYRKEYFEFNTANVAYVKYIIRLIGSSTPLVGTASGVMVINDISAKRNSAPKPAYVPMLDNVYSTLHAVVNQTGTNAPVISTAPFLNTYYNSATVKPTPSFSRLNTGDYVLTLSDVLLTGKCYPTSTGTTYFVAGGSVVVKWLTTSTYSIKTYNTVGAAADGILVDFLLNINTYW